MCEVCANPEEHRRHIKGLAYTDSCIALRVAFWLGRGLLLVASCLRLRGSLRSLIAIVRLLRIVVRLPLTVTRVLALLWGSLIALTVHSLFDHLKILATTSACFNFILE
jgi:hypothetical protein